MQPQCNFIENQSMARQYLFEVLSNDSVLLNSDSVFIDFYNKMVEEAEGQLNVVERNLAEYGKLDETFKNLLQATDVIIDSLAHLMDDMQKTCDLYPNYDCDSLTKAISNLLENAAITRQNIVVQMQTIATGQLQEARLENNLIVAEEVPEANSERVNELFFILEDSHYGVIADYYNELLAIAQQCPMYGGEAVYRARAILELYDENLSYDDDLNCLVYGYYRKSGATKLENERSKILVKPNPANEYISVTVTCNEYEMFSVQIINTLNQVLFDEKLQCNKENEINTKQLSPGVYTFIVKTKEGISSHKIAIIRW